MGWSAVPAAPGAVVEAAALMEARAAIIERRRATGRDAFAGSGDPPAVSAGDACLAETIDAYRQSIEEVLGAFLNISAPGQRWTKQAIMPAALGAGRSDWTTTPARAGALVEETFLPSGTPLYAEHLNDMKAVLDLLYMVPLEEKTGRMYCINDGTGWTWREEEFSPFETAGASGNYQVSSDGIERGVSVPYDFEEAPIGELPVTAVKAKGRLEGSDQDKAVKLISFLGSEVGDPPPSDRDWRAQFRVGEERPADSPRGADTDLFYTNNLVDDGTHEADSSARGQGSLRVMIEDGWELEIPAPEVDQWPFWMTFILEDYHAMTSLYAVEAAASGQELHLWAGSVWVAVNAAWAEADFEYLDR